MPPLPPITQSTNRGICREKEIKQLQGWKATVENLMERFEDLIRQAQLLAEIEEPGSSSTSSTSRLDGPDAAVAAEEGTLGPLAAGVARSSLLTATHHVQLNKLRWDSGRSSAWVYAVLTCVCCLDGCGAHLGLRRAALLLAGACLLRLW